MPPTSRSPKPRAMQIVSVRFGADQIELIQAEASVDGTSVSAFIRDAAYARAVLAAARRNAMSVQLFENMIAVIDAAGHDELGAQLREMLEPEGVEAVGAHETAGRERTAHDGNGSNGG